MAWTQTELDAVEAAIASGVLTVQYSDGRSVTYRSVSDLLKAHALIKAAVQATAGTTPSSCTYASFSKD